MHAFRDNYFFPFLAALCAIFTSGCVVETYSESSSSPTSTEADRRQYSPYSRRGPIQGPPTYRHQILNTDAFIDREIIGLIPRSNAIKLLSNESRKISLQRRCSVTDKGIVSARHSSRRKEEKFEESSSGVIYVVRQDRYRNTIFRGVIVIPGHSECESISTRLMNANGCFVFSESIDDPKPSRTLETAITSLAALNVTTCTITDPYPILR